MSKYCCNPIGNIRPKFEPQFIIIATSQVQPYTQEMKNTKNGGLSGKLSYKFIFDILNLNPYLTNNEVICNFITDQIIRKLISRTKRKIL